MTRTRSFALTLSMAVLLAAAACSGGSGTDAADDTAGPGDAQVDTAPAQCTVDTDLNITGKVAQFGRGALADVSDKLLLQFVDNLNALIASGTTTAAVPTAATNATAHVAACRG